MEDDERELVRRAHEGDEHAFVELVERSRSRVWAVCLRITGNPHDAENALQDALAAAWRNVRSFRGEARFSTWLYRIASNAALAVVDKRGLVADHTVDRPTHARDVGDRVADADRVQAALMTLSPDLREALVLRVYGELTYAEIARQQAVPIDTVKTRIFRARRALEQQLRDAG